MRENPVFLFLILGTSNKNGFISTKEIYNVLIKAIPFIALKWFSCHHHSFIFLKLRIHRTDWSCFSRIIFICLLIFLTVLSLLKDFLKDCVLRNRRITMLCQYQNQVHLQFCFDVRTIGPVGIFRLVVHHLLYGSSQHQQFIFWIFKAEFMSYFFGSSLI